MKFVIYFPKNAPYELTKPFTELYLLCFMLLHIECLKFVAFPQLFTSLLITKTFDCL